jgi:hypothetical protein
MLISGAYVKVSAKNVLFVFNPYIGVPVVTTFEKRVSGCIVKWDSKITTSVGGRSNRTGDEEI